MLINAACNIDISDSDPETKASIRELVRDFLKKTETIIRTQKESIAELVKANSEINRLQDEEKAMRASNDPKKDRKTNGQHLEQKRRQKRRQKRQRRRRRKKAKRHNCFAKTARHQDGKLRPNRFAKKARKRRQKFEKQKHTGETNSRKIYENKRKNICSHCNKRKHDASKCWTLHPNLMPKSIRNKISNMYTHIKPENLLTEI